MWKIGLAGAAALLSAAIAVASAEEADFTMEGELVRPDGWHEWIFVGAPLTPNALNDGEAAFPEFHNVYIDSESWGHWKQTGTFREGTMLAKELVLVGATEEVSGKGYFQGEFRGLEVALKSRERFPDEPGNWACFSFRQKPEPYTMVATASPTESCNACHEAAAADDFVFTQHYPVLRAAKPR